MQKSLDEILAVLVVYQRDITSADSVASLSRSLTTSGFSLDLFIHDNSPFVQSVDNSFKSLKIIYHHDPTNPGVAGAYNAGARFARESGKKWLLLLDQDTSFPVNALDVYAQAVADNAAIEMFAPRLVSHGRIFSPCGYCAGIGYHLGRVESGLMSLQGRGILNSGMLVRVDAFDAVGGFDERIPLDFADHDFCRRFADKFPAVFILDLDCGHGFSDREEAPLEAALARFAFFCRGARYSMRSFPDIVTHFVAASIRCVVLSTRYRTWRFIPVMLRELFAFDQSG
ncbi:glycosyl transferase family 2 [Geobacter sp. OR-1]|uniref:glycosyltransferase n=1 Tax=Geobacter sp. OR-1 TaxID=1266765 RepID=UPI000542CC12|nr:glycosyltransferase [Geobacter sp. OR-1]GAM11021.1 glycosyl transferase family 2 [Geobacter sp. OR-1]